MASKKSTVKFIYRGASSSKFEPGQVLEVTERFAGPYRESSNWKEVVTVKKSNQKSKTPKGDS